MSGEGCCIFNCEEERICERFVAACVSGGDECYGWST